VKRGTSEFRLRKTKKGSKNAGYGSLLHAVHMNRHQRPASREIKGGPLGCPPT